MNAIDLTGRTAVVTGGAGGIGAATAARFLASGARVALWDLDEAAAGRGGTDLAVGVDVTDAAAVAAAVARTEAALGPIDILVNGAGSTGPNMAVIDTDPAAWRACVELNLTGVFLCCRAVLPGMLRSGYGRIVNLASIAGKEGNPQQAAYSAAKAGVIAFTKSLAKEVAASAIRVNAVVPAMIDSPLVLQMPDAVRSAVLAKIPLGRPGRPEEVAALVAWLASEECSFSTGAAFDLSGGRATY